MVLVINSYFILCDFEYIFLFRKMALVINSIFIFLLLFAAFSIVFYLDILEMALIWKFSFSLYPFTVCSFLFQKMILINFFFFFFYLRIKIENLKKVYLIQFLYMKYLCTFYIYFYRIMKKVKFRVSNNFLFIKI